MLVSVTQLHANYATPISLHHLHKNFMLIVQTAALNGLRCLRAGSTSLLISHALHLSIVNPLIERSGAHCWLHES